MKPPKIAFVVPSIHMNRRQFTAASALALAGQAESQTVQRIHHRASLPSHAQCAARTRCSGPANSSARERSPALERAGAGTAGFFASVIAEESPFILALATFPSLAALETIREKQAQDPEYRKARDAYNSQAGLGYVRLDSSLLRCFEAMPRPEPPPHEPGKPPAFLSCASMSRTTLQLWRARSKCSAKAKSRYSSGSECARCSSAKPSWGGTCRTLFTCSPSITWQPETRPGRRSGAIRSGKSFDPSRATAMRKLFLISRTRFCGHWPFHRFDEKHLRQHRSQKADRNARLNPAVSTSSATSTFRLPPLASTVRPSSGGFWRTSIAIGFVLQIPGFGQCHGSQRIPGLKVAAFDVRAVVSRTRATKRPRSDLACLLKLIEKGHVDRDFSGCVQTHHGNRERRSRIRSTRRADRRRGSTRQSCCPS